jgi:GNAT superfamily N-acetyltransferase
MNSDVADFNRARSVGAVIRPMVVHDLDTVDHVMRVAFGTFLSTPHPPSMFGETQYIRPRFNAEPRWAFVAEVDTEVVGSVLASRWGSFAFLGPLTVRPDLWDRGIARQLLEPVVDLFDQWDVELAGLHTFAQSAKHVGLYQRFEFWPQYLTAIMAKPVSNPPPTSFHRFSDLNQDQRESILTECATLTDAIFNGLDVSHEIRAVAQQSRGDTLLLYDDEHLSGFAVCHYGAGEAGLDNLFVKFAAARPGLGAEVRFARLLESCEELASELALATIVAGVSTGRHGAYIHMLNAGFRTQGQGVRMHRPNAVGYCRPRDFVIDDLR